MVVVVVGCACVCVCVRGGEGGVRVRATDYLASVSLYGFNIGTPQLISNSTYLNTNDYNQYDQLTCGGERDDLLGKEHVG